MVVAARATDAGADAPGAPQVAAGAHLTAPASAPHKKKKKGKKGPAAAPPEGDEASAPTQPGDAADAPPAGPDEARAVPPPGGGSAAPPPPADDDFDCGRPSDCGRTSLTMHAAGVELRGALSHTFGVRSWASLGRVVWAAGHWTFDGRELVRYADAAELAEVCAYAPAVECTAGPSRFDGRAFALSDVTCTRGDGAAAASAGALHLRASSAAEGEAWSAAMSTALRQRRAVVRKRIFDAKAAARYVPPPQKLAQHDPAPAKAPAPLAKLEAMRLRYDAFAAETDALEAALGAFDARPEFKLKSKNTIAQLLSQLDKLQFVGVDGVVTSEIADEAERAQAKAMRKQLNADIDVLRKAIDGIRHALAAP